MNPWHGSMEISPLVILPCLSDSIVSEINLYRFCNLIVIPNAGIVGSTVDQKLSPEIAWKISNSQISINYDCKKLFRSRACIQDLRQNRRKVNWFEPTPQVSGWLYSSSARTSDPTGRSFYIRDEIFRLIYGSFDSFKYGLLENSASEVWAGISDWKIMMNANRTKGSDRDELENLFLNSNTTRRVLRIGGIWLT